MRQLKQIVLVLLTPAVIAMAIGCAQTTPNVWDDPAYEDWEFFNGGPIKFFYPPEHMHKANLGDYCNNYIRSAEQICELLAISVPAETLIVVYYTGFGQGRTMTEREYPFAQDSIIHFWLPSHPGPSMVDWLLPKWSSVDSRHDFLRHGMRSLFDFSGQNYHSGIYAYRNRGMLMTLEELVADTTVDSDLERLQSCHAASFVAFILAEYGPTRLRTLYESPNPFDSTVNSVLHLSVGSLETAWMGYAAQSTPDSILNPPEEALDSSTTE
ncbi:MAG: hypothetical protein V3T31_13320 [candidate division Zixibacteria bacterium]